MRTLLLITLFVSLFLTACGGAGDGTPTGQTQVTIGLGQSVAVGAIGAPGAIPTNIQSMSVTAFNAAGGVLAGPVFANAPNLSVTLTLANGNNVHFLILAFSAANGGGVELHRGEITANLTGGAVSLPVKMNLTVAVTPSQIMVQRGQIVSLLGTVSGKSPPASSPLLWQSSGGRVQSLDVYGNNARWTAPNILGTFNIDAYINPNINPDQNVTVFGRSTITVINLPPIAVDDYAATRNLLPITIPVLANDSDPENDALVVASVTQGVRGSVVNNNTALVYTANAGATGTDQFIYTVRDAFGATATATVFITLNDQTPPVITAPSAITIEATSGSGTPVSTPSIQNFLNSVTATDNIAVASLTNNAPTQFLIGVTPVIFTAIDTAGNQSTAQSSITVQDTTAPILTIPADIYAEATGAQTTLALGTATATDLVSGIVTATSNAPATYPVGTTQVIWSAVDAYANLASAIQNITIQDTIAPTVSPPASITVAAVNAAGTPAGNASITAFLTGATATDLVSGNVVPTHNGLTTFPIGTTTVTFSATDAKGNTGTATATITVVDQTLPVVTAPANITVAALDAYGTPASDPYIATFLAAATANDNVDGAITPSNNAPAQFPLGVTTVSFSATDVYGNTGNATATVTVQNQSAPTVTAPANLIVAAVNATGTAASDPYITAFLKGATAVDLLGNVLAVTHNGLTQFPLGTTTVTFSATDANGNTGTATATITVSDQTKPVVTVPVAITVAAVDAYGTPATDPYITAFLNAATAIDNVAITPVITNDAYAQLPIGTTTVIFSANDGYGNIGTGSSTITVTDLTAPVVTAPADMYAEATATFTPITLGAATVVDNVNTGLVATANKTSPFPVGLTLVTWSSTDAYGNTGTAVQRVTITDTTAPTLNIPADIYTEATAAQSSVVIGTATANDLVFGAITPTNNAPATFAVGTTVVLWNAIDGYGNTVSLGQNITVQDTTAPTLIIPTDVYVEATGAQTMLALGTATANDLVDGALIAANNAPASFTVGTTLVSWSVTDAKGNTATAVQRIVVSDTTPPTLNIPADVYVEATSLLTNVAIGTATASDLVSGTLTPTSNAPAAYPVGVTGVTWTITDGYGNTATAIQTIIVQDTTVPNLTIPIDVYAEATAPFTTVALGTSTATDLVDGVLTATNNAPVSFPVGITLVTWTVSDIHANTATAVQRVVVSDTTAPALVLPTDIYTEATGVQTTVAIGTAIATDLVSGIVTPTSNAPATYPVGITQVTWSAVDAYANTASAIQTITIQDTTAPTVSPPASITVAAVNAAGTPAGNASITAFLTAATAIDLVSGNVVPTHNGLTTFPIGTTTVTFSATDAKGNTGTATATITVVDQTLPVVTAPANITVAAVDAYGTPASDPYIATFLAAATANDNVDGAITPSNNAPAQFPLGVTTVSFSATDVYGNTGNATATVTVQNQSAPTVTAPVNLTVAAVNQAGTAASDPYITAFLNGATAIDLLGNVLAVTHNGLTQFPLGTTTVTFSATDANANTGTATATITVSDQTKPVVTAPAAITVAAVDAYGTPATDPYITAFLNAATAIDNVAINPIITNDAYAQLPLGTTTVVFSANDGYGNIGTASSTITIADLSQPVITAPTDIYTEATATFTSITLGTATVIDNVDTSLVATANKASPFPVGLTIITWSSTDAYGNVGTATQNVTITDTTAPTLNIPADIYTEATAAQSSVVIGTATANDLVFGAITPTNNAPATFAVGTTVVLWNAIDGYANGVTLSQNITVQDTTAPTLIIPTDIYVEATGAQTTLALGTATASDLVDGALIPSNNAPASFTVGMTVVSWSVTDAKGNTATAVQRIVVSDTTPPTLNIPADVYAEATSLLTNVAIGTATASDLVSGTLTPTSNAPAAYPVGVTGVAWTITDGYGNTATAIQTIIVQDTTVPNLTIPADVYAEATAPFTTVALGTSTATDLVDGVLTATNNAPVSFPVGITLVTWTVSDVHANTATAVQRVLISDTTAPALLLPADIYTEATGIQTTVAIGTATATDLVSGIVTPTSNAPATYPVGITQVTWSAVDAYANTASAIQNITIQDTTAPTVNPPASITVAAVNAAGTPAGNANITAFLTGATATDLVSGNVVPTHNGLTTFPIGTTTVTFSASDGKGNTGTATATITVVDQTLPVVTAPANITVAALDAYGTPASDPYIATFLAAATANDNVDGVITPSNNAPAQFPLGVTTVSFSATDVYGNTGNATAIVTVQNQSAPTMTAPANLTVAAVNATGIAASDPYITAFLNGATAVDLLGNVLVVTHNGLTQFPLGTTTVTFSATDANANTGTATATITVSDQTKPVVTAPAAITVAAVDAYGTPATDPYITAFLNAATAIDNVAINPIITNDTYAQLPMGTTTVIFSANDGYGNIGTASSTITITDLSQPVITVPADIYTEATATFTSITLGIATVVDNVDTGLLATANKTSPFPVGLTLVTWSSADGYGNTGTAVQRVTITDTTAPALTAPTDVYASTTGVAIPVPLGSPLVSDLVDAAPSVVNDAPATFAVGTTQVTWSASDVYGNTATATQQVTVSLNQVAPVINSPADPYTLVVAEDNYAYVTATATDANGDTLIWDMYSAAINGAATVDAYSGAISYIGNLNYNGADAFTVRISDPYANSALLHVNVTVTPVNDIPVLTLLGNDPVDIYTGLTYVDAGATALDVEEGDLTISIVSSNTVNTAVAGTYVVTYDVTDSYAGVAAQLTRIVNVTTSPYPAGTTHVWTGALDTAWNVAGNWDVGTVPTTASNVFIPASSVNQPRVTANAVTRNVIIQNGATLDIATFTLTASGDVRGGNTIIGSTGSLIMNGVAVMVEGTLPNLVVSGSVRLTALTTVTGNLSVNANAVLDLYGQSLDIYGNLTVTANNTKGLLMQNPADVLTVRGNALFHASVAVQNAANMSAGILYLRGNVTANNAPSFASTGSQKVVLDGTLAQTVTFSGGSSASSNRFNHLDINNSAGVNFASATTYVTGQLTMLGGGVLTGTNVSYWNALPASAVGWVGAYNVATTHVPANATVALSATLNQLTLKNLAVDGNGSLNINGQSLTVSGNLSVTANGIKGLLMQSAGDWLTVNGNASFFAVTAVQSPSNMTVGVLQLQGNMTTDSAGRFISAGTHKVILDGTTAQTVTFSGGSSAANNRFNDIEISNAIGISFTTSTFVGGSLSSPVAITGKLSTNGALLTIPGGVNVDGLILDNTPLSITGGTITAFDNVTFQNYAPTATQLSLNLTGVVRTFNNLQFLSLPTTGLYVSGIGASTIDIYGSTPQYGIPKTSVAGGFVLNWGVGTEDSDGDGLTDADEFAYGTNPFDSDTDRDGFSDLQEIIAGTDPLSAASTPTGAAMALGTWLDFEDVYAGGLWTDGTIWEHGITTWGPKAAHSGSNVWATVLNGKVPPSTQAYLYLPQIDLYGTVNPTLSMNLWADSDGGTRLEVFDAITSTWTAIDPYITPYDGIDGVGNPAWVKQGLFSGTSNDIYRLAAFDLTAYASQTIQVRLAHRQGGYVWGWDGIYIDDIRLNDESSDPDGDGINGVINEWNIAQTDPFLADTDGDGVNDGTEIAAGTNPRNGAVYTGASTMVLGTWLDFEDVYAGGLWTDGTIWEHGITTWGPKAAHSGSNVWATVLNGKVPPSTQAYLYLPQIDLYGTVNPTLSMNLWADSDGGTRLEVFDAITSIWTAIDPYITPYDGADGAGNPAWVKQGVSSIYRLAAFDLTTYAGQTIQVRLAHRQGSYVWGGDGIYIDDIRLNDESSDPDGDGINGIINEWNVLGTDPFVADTDGDGVNDSLDTYPLNPNQTVTTPGFGVLDYYAVTDSSSVWQHGVPSGNTATVSWQAPGVDPYVWATNLSGTIGVIPDAHLYLPIANLTAATQPIMTMRLFQHQNANQGITVEAFDAVTSQWIAVTPYAAVYPYNSTNMLGSGVAGWGLSINYQSPGNYQFIALDLSSYVGKKVQLRITERNWNGAWGSYVTNIRIDEESSDADGDGIVGVIAEWLTYGTDPMIADTDGDGINDGAEVTAGTNPLDPLSHGNRVPTAGTGLPSAGLIAYYPFDGNANDQTANANHLTVTNATLVAGRNGNANSAYSFDGATTSMRAVVGAEMSVSSLTMAGWVKVKGTGTLASRYFGVGPANSTFQYYALIQNAAAQGSNLWYYSSNTTPNLNGNSGAWSDGTWHHIAVTDNGATRIIYIDGVEHVQGTTFASLTTFSSAILQIGASDNGSDRVNADMDDVRFYNRALSQQEIKALAGLGNISGNNHYVINQNSYASIQLTGFDRDNDPLTYTIIAPPAAGILYQTVDGYTQGAAIVNPYTQVTDIYARVVFVPTAGATGQPYASFDYYVSDPYSISSSAVMNIDVIGNTTVIAAANGNNIMNGANCNTVWDRYSSPYWVQSNVTIAAGCRLQIDAYTVVKLDAAVQIRVQGNAILDVYATVGSPVIFTSIKDDTVAGDTNNDGILSLPAAGDWQNIYYEANAGGSIQYAELRYAGSNTPWGALYLASSIAINGLTVKSSASHSLVIDGSAAPTIANSLFDNSTGEAIYLTSTNNGIMIDTSNTISNAPAAYLSEQGMPIGITATIGAGVPVVSATGRLEVGVTFASLVVAQFTAWETQIGRPLRRVQRMYNLDEPAYLWNTEVFNTMNAGYKLLLTFEPKLNVDIYATSPSRLLAIAAGTYDAQIDASINGIINNVQPSFPNADIWIRIGQEMNGDWYPWGGLIDAYGNPHNGNTASNYIAAYQHIVQRYRAAGLAENMVKFIWSPNVWPTDNFTMFYPGDPYTDYIGVAGFNFGPNTVLHPNLTWQTFNTIYSFTYTTMVAAYPSKQIVIGGISSAESGGSKAAWVTDMATQLKNGYPSIVGVFWFNIDKTNIGETNWKIDSSPSSLTAVQQMYLDNLLWR